MADDILAQVRRLDLWILHHLNSLSGDWLVDHMIDFISSSNLIKGAVPIAIYWYFWFNGTSGRVQNRVVLVKGVIAAIVAVAAARGLAHMLPVELRPFADPTSGFVPPLEATQRNFENWSAFPSDTAAYEFALGTSLFFISPFWGAALLMFTGIASCATRVFIGIHYPSDILVGALIGVCAAWGSQKLPARRLHALSVVQGTGNHPWFYSLAFLVTAEMAQVFENVREARTFAMAVKHRVPEMIAISMVLVALAGAVLLILLAVRLYLLRSGRKVARKIGDEVRRMQES